MTYIETPRRISTEVISGDFLLWGLRKERTGWSWSIMWEEEHPA